MKATQRGKSWVYRGQPGSASQSEETTTADRLAQISKDHQNIGRVKIGSFLILIAFRLNFYDDDLEAVKLRLTFLQLMLTHVPLSYYSGYFTP